MIVMEDAPRVRKTDPITSHIAADSNNVQASQLAVLRVLNVTRAPIADHEIHTSIEIRPERFSNGVVYSGSRVRTARHELEESGFVELVEGKKVLTPDGGWTRTWTITDRGRDFLAANR